MPRQKKFSKKISPIAPGAIGAAAGAALGAATGVLLSSKKARQKVKSGINDVKEYAQEALSAMEVSMQESKSSAKLGRGRRKILAA